MSNADFKVKVWGGAQEGEFVEYLVPRNPSQTVLDVEGVSRTKESLFRARAKLDQLGQQLHQIGVGDIQRKYSVTWQDWMNLNNPILVSKSVTEAALSREHSRGVHYRDDFPRPGSLEESYFTAVQLGKGGLEIKNRPVQFTMIKLGQTILVEA